MQSQVEIAPLFSFCKPRDDLHWESFLNIAVKELHSWKDRIVPDLNYFDIFALSPPFFLEREPEGEALSY